MYNNLTVVAFIVWGTMSLNDTCSIVPLAGPNKLVIYLKICH